MNTAAPSCPNRGQRSVNSRPQDGPPPAFFGTPFVQWLTQQGAQMLVVTGAVTSGCLRACVVAAMSWVCAQLSSAIVWVKGQMRCTM
jgi:hypothetical protein